MVVRFIDIRNVPGRKSDVNDERVVYIGETVDGEYATVRSKIVTGGGTEIPIDYRLRQAGSRWVAFDIAISGVSLVSSYRLPCAAAEAEAQAGESPSAERPIAQPAAAAVPPPRQPGIRAGVGPRRRDGLGGDGGPGRRGRLPCRCLMVPWRAPTL